MSLIKDLLEKPPNLSTASKYTTMNGVIYLATGARFIAWPGVVQTIYLWIQLSSGTRGRSFV